MITDDATSDLRTLKIYLADYFSQQVAKDIILKIIRQLRQLRYFPKLGTSAVTIDQQLNDYRYLRDKRNTIFYRIDQKKMMIIIERIFDNRENIIRELNDYLDNELPFDNI